MMALSPLLLPAFLGWFFLGALLRKTCLPGKVFLILTAGPAIGLSLISLILFFSLVISSSHAQVLVQVLSFILLVISTVVFLKNTSFQIPAFRMKSFQPKPLQILLTVMGAGLFLFFFWYFLLYFMDRLTHDILGGWDARYLWHLKARFLYRDPEQWTHLFSPKVGWENQDYPLMLPGMIAWGWIWTGQETLIWAPAVSLVFMLALCGVVLWYLGTYCAWHTAFLAAAFLFSMRVFRFWTAQLYADIPLTFFITLSALLLMTALREKEKRLFLLCGFLAGCGAWTKNEGILTLVCLGLLLAAVSVKTSESSRKGFLLFFAGCAIPLIAVLLLKLGYDQEGAYFFARRTPAEYWQLMTDSGRVRFIGYVFSAFKLHPQWHRLWLFFSAALLLWLLRKGPAEKENYRWILPALILMVEAGYFTVFLITPVELRFHLQTSLMRLLMHTAGWALVFTFETFGSLTRPRIPHCKIKPANRLPQSSRKNQI